MVAMVTFLAVAQLFALLASARLRRPCPQSDQCVAVHTAPELGVIVVVAGVAGAAAVGTLQWVGGRLSQRAADALTELQQTQSQTALIEDLAAKNS